MNGRNLIEAFSISVNGLVSALFVAGTNTALAIDWDKNLPSAARFTPLATFNNEAVRDNETGLVWERAPDPTTRIWGLSTGYCANKNVGGTVGWRLPSVIELRSVQDPLLPAPFVPENIFTDVLEAVYWSSSSSAEAPTTHAWVVSFAGGIVLLAVKQLALPAWCVRGPMQESVY